MEPATENDMADTAAIPELQKPHKPRAEKRSPKREPEMPHLPLTEEELLDKDDQADSGPEKDNPLTRSSKGPLTQS